MAYQMYRNTTLGLTLQETLDELIQNGSITPQLALRMMIMFDKCINKALATRVKSKLTFKAGHLKTYRFCDNVWTFVMSNVEFRESQEVAFVEKVKIVACDGRVAAQLPGGGGALEGGAALAKGGIGSAGRRSR